MNSHLVVSASIFASGGGGGGRRGSAHSLAWRLPTTLLDAVTGDLTDRHRLLSA